MPDTFGIGSTIRCASWQAVIPLNQWADPVIPGDAWIVPLHSFSPQWLL